MINLQGKKIWTVSGISPATMKKFLAYTFGSHYIGMKIDNRTFIPLLSEKADKDEIDRFQEAFRMVEIKIVSNAENVQ